MSLTKTQNLFISTIIHAILREPKLHDFIYNKATGKTYCLGLIDSILNDLNFTEKPPFSDEWLHPDWNEAHPRVSGDWHVVQDFPKKTSLIKRLLHWQKTLNNKRREGKIKNHVKIYLNHYNYGEEDIIICECGCGKIANQIHHLVKRGMGGSKTRDNIENLIALTMKCHEKADTDTKFNNKLKSIKKREFNGKSN